MILVKPIPVDLNPGKIAEVARRTETERLQAVDAFSNVIEPSGAFGEFKPEQILDDNSLARPIWGDTVVAGVCTLGDGVSSLAMQPDKDGLLFSRLTAIALRDVLDFLEYKIRMYLKAAGKTPGPRIIPGCDEAPLKTNLAILKLFGPQYSLGFTVTDSGAPANPVGMTFIYPTAEWTRVSVCDQCKNRSCPARIT